MKLLSSALLALSLFMAAPAFASDCNCDKACQEKCAKGETKDCPCNSCDCKKGNNCSHGKCKE